ncbi:hypothetical protein [Thermus filiformis]|jgi:hypothetical protein|nr:hypothetical protein [Thermus filiformis]
MKAKRTKGKVRVVRRTPPKGQAQAEEARALMRKILEENLETFRLLARY